MGKKLDKALNNILSAKLEENIAGVPVAMNDYRYDIRDDAAGRSQEYSEPEDKIIIAIQNLLVNGEYEAASALIQSSNFSGPKGGGISWYHMEKLVDWVRSIYKYTDTRDLSKSYYDYQMKQEIDGAQDLRKTGVSEKTVERFVKEVEKVLKKKLEMR